MFSLIKNIYRTASRKERKVVLENAFSLSALQGINYILPLLILPYVIRVIGPEKFGLIAFAQAFAQYFMILVDYGFNFSATREVSLYRDQKDKICAIFSAVMTIKVVMALASFLILLLVVEFVPKFKSDYLVYVFSFAAVAGNALFPMWFFQGMEKMKYITALNITAGIIYALGIFIFVKKPADYLYIPLINSLVLLIAGFLGLGIVVRKFGIIFICQTYADIKEQLKSGWHVFSSILSINAYTTTRIFAVGLLTNNTLTGYYSIAEKIANVIQTFPLDSFSRAIYPRLSHIFLKNRNKAARLMYKIQRVTTNGFLISLPVLFFFAPGIVKIVCGADYRDVTVVLRLLLVSVFFVGANAFKVQFLLVCGKTDVYAKIHALMAMLGLPLIFLMICSFSYAGAAVSTIIIEAGIFVLTLQALKKP